MDLPKDFVNLMIAHLGQEQAESLLEGLDAEPSVSIRLNPLKKALLDRLAGGDSALEPLSLPKVPWCPDAYYLDNRPAFTFDPLFHAGVYYVQEAGSMYLAEMVRKYVPHEHPLRALDLCAAPGGKSTLLHACLPEGSLLVSNEPMPKRAQVLAENLIKWGYPATVVTQNYPDDFASLTSTFDLILTDVPCSGEGMFRKDDEAVRDWSLENVDTCWHRQRSIVESIWPTLKEGGILVYSTCTFNRFEDEDNVAWIAETFGAEVLEQRHFFPGRDRGEGFFIAALRKVGELIPLEVNGSDFVRKETKDSVTLYPALHASLMQKMQRILHTHVCGVQMMEKGVKDWAPTQAWAMCTAYERGTYPEYELTYAEAISYLRREALRIDAPRGYVLVTYRGVPLGFVKSVGNRANNLYPQEWRIRTTYTSEAPHII